MALDGTYVDGFVLAVPTDKKDAYREMADIAAQVFKDYGALSIVECWGDDVPAGEVTSFPLAVKATPGETVVFSWAVWPSKEVRDAAVPKITEDKRLHPEGGMPFDGKRMIWGGFTVLLDN